MAKTYELKADQLSMPVNKPNEPFRVKEYRKGDKVEGLSEDRARELIAAGALVDPDAEKAEKSGKPAQSRAPKGKAGQGQQTAEVEPSGSGTTEGGTAGAGAQGSAPAGQTGDAGKGTAGAQGGAGGNQ